jgi:hypothetical protein
VEAVEDEYGDMPYEPLSRYKYDTDWSATGPLIERLSLDVTCSPAERAHPWCANVAYSPAADPVGFGMTPLIAVCNLILALKEAGKLEAA